MSSFCNQFSDNFNSPDTIRYSYTFNMKLWYSLKVDYKSLPTSTNMILCLPFAIIGTKFDKLFLNKSLHSKHAMHKSPTYKYFKYSTYTHTHIHYTHRECRTVCFA